MSLTLNPEQQLLRENARQWVREAAPVGQLRKLRDMRDEAGFSRDAWLQMAAFGWPGIVFPEQYGGLGLGFVELGVVLEECGRTLVASPLISSVLLGGGVVAQGGSEQQKQAILPGVCAGTRIVALAFEETARFSPYQIKCKAERQGSGYKLTGQKTFVLDGHVADTVIVAARTSGAAGDRDGITLFLLDASQTGLKLERTLMLDSRNAAKCTLEAVSVSNASVIGQIDKGAEILDPVLDRAAACLAAELFGIVSQAYETTLEYLKTRVQFDALIGSFQALQHRAVDMFCELELSKSLVLDALSAIDDKREDAAIMASAAKARLSAASRWITREAIQLHGGIGMTDEHDMGLYLKRAAALEVTFGDAAHHREKFATLRGGY